MACMDGQVGQGSLEMIRSDGRWMMTCERGPTRGSGRRHQIQPRPSRRRGGTGGSTGGFLACKHGLTQVRVRVAACTRMWLKAVWAFKIQGYRKCNNNNNIRRLVTLAEHTSDHGRQSNSSTEEKGEQV